MTDYENNEEIKIFREYLRIPTVHPDIDYEPCVEFLLKLASDIGLESRVIRNVPNKPIVLITWKGTDEGLPTLLLNSHTDVVPVFEEHWTYPPFAAEMDKDGKIFARGSQDMKCVGMQYLSALKALKLNGFNPKRTIHVSFVPEEETGGVGGMSDFVETEEFKQLNVGFELDESAASPFEAFMLFYAERPMWSVKFTINGTTGHGSLLLTNTVGEKARILIDRIDDFRKMQMKKLENNPILGYSDATTINLTIIEGGVQSNVIPPQLTLTYDVRVSIKQDHNEFERMLNEWCTEAGRDITIEYKIKEPHIEPTRLDETNIYWNAMKKACDDMNLKLMLIVSPGGTDARFIRSKNIPAVGFSPMNNTPILLHDHNEYLSADVYLRGIEIYKNVIQNIASI